MKQETMQEVNMKGQITHDSYLQAAKLDRESAKSYFTKSVNKTEQQKALESLLLDSIARGELDSNAPYTIADFACGGGTLSYHLASIFPNARFVLMDYNEQGLELARGINADSAHRMEFVQGDLRNLPFEDSSFDLAFCWGVFLIFDEETLQAVINETYRTLKPSGKLYASSLFNTEFDVDLKCDFRDYTRESGKAGIWGRYSTFSLPTMRRLMGAWGDFSIHPFCPQIDFPRTTHRGIATYSVRVAQDSKHIKVGENFGGAFVGDTQSKHNSEAEIETIENDLTSKRSAVVSQSFRSKAEFHSAAATPRVRDSANSEINKESLETNLIGKQSAPISSSFRRRRGALPCETIPSVRDSANSDNLTGGGAV